MTTQERIISTTIDLKHQMPIDTSIYITDINSRGIQIHPKTWGPNNSSYLELDGNELNIKDINSILLASFNQENISIGNLVTGHTIIDDAGLQVYDSLNQKVLDTTTSGIRLYKANSLRAAVTDGGLDIYGNDGITKLASYGSTTIIGNESYSHLKIKNSGVELLGIQEDTSKVITTLKLQQFGIDFISGTQNTSLLFLNRGLIQDGNNYMGGELSISLPNAMTVDSGSNLKRIFLSDGSTSVNNSIEMLTLKYQSETSEIVNATQVFKTGGKSLTLSNRKSQFEYRTDSVSSFLHIYDTIDGEEQLQLEIGVSSNGSLPNNRGIRLGTNDWLIRRDSLGSTYVGSIDLTDSETARNSLHASGAISIKVVEVALGSVNANTYKSGSENYSPGYPYAGRCIVGWYFSGTNTSNFIPTRIYYNQTDETIEWGVRNTSSSAVSGGKLIVFVLGTYSQ